MNTSWKRFKFRVVAPSILKLKGWESMGGSTIVPPFFLWGSGRNGSTLLSAFLNNHSQIFLPPEQYTMPFHAMKWALGMSKTWDSWVEHVIGDWQVKNKTSNWNLDWPRLEGRLKDLIQERRTFAQTYDEVIRAYSEEHGKFPRLWGDQSPLMTHFSKILLPIFPDAKIVMLVRDPRDVVLSYSRFSGHVAQSIDQALWKWTDSIAVYDQLHRKGHSVLLLKYEELVQNPREAVGKVLEFLGLPWEDILDQTKNTKVLGVEDNAQHQNLKKPVFTSSIGKWKKDLPAEKVSYIHRKVPKLMDRFGYEY